MTDDEIEAVVDRAFLRLYGRTYRPDEPRPAPIKTQSEASRNGDSLGHVVHDFHKLLSDD
jgi:hypothetical protein